ncbi:hypothetical protein ZHAS_00012011 [Anopheles sinensis]|uniref:Acyl_transf_3 domain-containing protein n=1 Tax=Anopheles sinensis TaxID=74873 RepID=A0A084W1S7_ANOSI|nr:hypothetical protein ZHAS_00012011 [Anopheles sinensis]
MTEKFTQCSLCVVSLWLSVAAVVRGEDWVAFINSKAYQRFPKLFAYDELDDCRADWGDQFQYCVVRSPLIPYDPRSELWQNLTKFSSSPRHYDHTKVERGICVPECVATNLIGGIVTNASVELQYSRHLRQCVNEELRKKYDLQVDLVTIQYCYHNNEEELFRIGRIQIVFGVIVSGIVVLTVVSSLYDRRRQVVASYPENHYTTPPTERWRELLVSFSVMRNFVKLYQPTPDGRFRADLQTMEGFRAIRMFLIVFLHTCTAYMKLPQHNPDFLERYNHAESLIGYVARFQDSVQTFFLISAILFTVSFLRDRQDGITLNAGYLFRCIANRLLRLLPAYAFVVLLQVAALPYFMEGPFGKQFLGEATDNCLRNWWTNTLFINNYVGADQPCLLQSWYIAADTQLYIFCLLTLSLVWQYRRLKCYLFTATIVYGLVAPATVAYYQNTTPLMVVDMKQVDNYMRLQPFQSRLYFPFHLNLAVYFGGVLVGSAYHRYRTDWCRFYRSCGFKLFALLACTVYAFTFATSSWFVENYSSLDRWLVATYATIFKHSWAMFNALLLLVLFSLPAHNWLKQLLHHPIVSFAGRLSYSVYLLHFSVIVLVFGQTRGPVMSNEFTVSTYASQIILWTYTFSLGLCVLVELPAQNIAKLLLTRRTKCRE